MPHPLGPRDVIEALTPWTRTIVTAVAVIAVAVGAYLLGASREKLVILDAPTAETGVLWHCGPVLLGVVRLDAGPVAVEIGDRRIATSIGSTGQLRLPLDVGLPESLPDRVVVEGSGRRLSVPVLSCVPPRPDP